MGSPVVPLVKSSTAGSSGSTPPSASASGPSDAKKAARLDHGQPVDAVAQAGRDRGFDHGQARCGPLQNGGQLGIGEAVVHRHVGNAGQGGGEQAHGDRLGVDVHRHQALGPFGLEVAGHGPDLLEEPLVGQVAVVAGGHRHPVGQGVGHDLQQ